MGVAYDRGRLAIGTHVHVWEFHNQPPVAPTLEPAGKHDACFLPRFLQVTGQIGIHEIGWIGNELWIVNTRFFVPVYPRPPVEFCATLATEFITKWQPKIAATSTGSASATAASST